MTGTSAQEIMSAAMTLEEGDKIVTPCQSFDEMETLRKNLYRLKNIVMKTNKTLAYALQISRETKDNNWLVIVTKELTATGVIIIKKNGSVKALERTEPAVVGDETEAGRMVRLMKQDGMTDEEIDDALAEKGEDDFDKAATAIEEAQEAASESDSEKKGGD